jgi:hypothetical protein
LKVIDILGREVATLVDNEHEPGEHSIIFDAKDMPNGVYFYRLQTGENIQQKAMIIVR